MRVFKRKSGVLFLISAIFLAAPAEAVTQNEFMDLCLTGDAESVAAALKESGISPSRADARGNTPLMIAATAKGSAADPDKIRLLINAGNKITARNKEGLQALALAARSSDNPDVIAELVHAGADIEEKSPRGWTPLSFAAARNPNPAIVNVLFDLGASVNAQDRERSTPLMLAVRGGNSAAVLNALLDNGADPLLPNSTGKTPDAFLDAKKFTPEELAALQERMKRDNTPTPASPERFAETCRRGIEPRVRYFLEARTDPNAAAADGMTPLMLAALENSWPGVIGTLIQYGALTDARDADGRTALMLAAASGRNPAALNELLLSGARADFRDEAGKTALDYARENPLYEPHDLQMLTSTLAAVAEAEKRGAQLEIDRRNGNTSEPTDMTRLAELFRRMAADQEEIVRLSDDAASARQRTAEALENERTATARAEGLQQRLEDAKQLAQELSAQLETLRDERQKDTDLARENVNRLTSLWNAEMQKSAALAEENSQSFKKEKEQFDAEIKRLEEKYRAETESLNAQLAACSEKLAQSEENRSAETLRHRQETTAAEEAHARRIEEAERNNARILEDLKEQHRKELAEAASIAELRRADEAAALAALAEEKKKDALRAERERHAEEMTQLRRELEAERTEQLAALEKQKNEELRRATDEYLRETSAQKRQYADVLTVLNAYLNRERAASAKARSDFSDLKARSDREKTAFQESLARVRTMDDIALAQRLEEQEENLRVEFDAEAARLKEEYRRQLSEAAAKFEEQTAAEIDRLKRQHETELNEKLTELYDTIEKLKAVPVVLPDAEPAAEPASQPAPEQPAADEAAPAEKDQNPPAETPQEQQ